MIKKQIKHSGRKAARILLGAGLTALLAGCAGRTPKLPETEGTLNPQVSEEANPSASQEEPLKEEPLKVVTTVFPYYDFTRQISGGLIESGQVELELIVPAGMDSHSFEPTPADIIKIQDADLIICNGGAMEQWFERVLDSLDTQNQQVITMMDYVDTVEEEIVEGMEAEEHDHSHDHVHPAGVPKEGEEGHLYDDGHEQEIEYDEHIWTSPVNAMTLSEVIAGTLCEMDESNQEIYRENLAEYEEKLSALDQKFRDIAEHGKRRLVVFGDKFPLRYFFDEYGLEYRAAFSGCSTDTEPSAKTIAYLIDKVRELDIPAVYYLELSSHRVAEIIGEETGAEPLLFHSCHNVTRREFDSGVTYLELMEQNAVNLSKGLN
ncbi:metal ABC transporter substrate-binding protein [Clostridium sp. M62/1]|uniref:metal ABC transporter substrate-binding protein n=1 Tax=Clostridium sp. M62/1 TaxID=411486 RepID=UPI0001C34C30|nr:metal ABC transporter substrate-binding protein [Clostridium sp. M62/1]UEB77976.1 metal ABC transporter substrate-binding protein [Clostridium sp. M62/1]HJG83735.1 metal ABC transporter substrate-binding protein [Lacrimispora saccharolytica]